MSTYDAIRNVARAFEREFVRSDPATPAPVTLATLAQALTALIGTLPGPNAGVSAVIEKTLSGAPVPLGHNAQRAAQNAAYFAAAAAAHTAAVEAAAADTAAQKAVGAATATTA